MNMSGSIKCITTLLKTIKVIRCVKKVEIGVIISIVILVGIGTVRENKNGIIKAVKRIKKKVA